MGSFIRQQSFAGGEIGPAWWGRDEVDRYGISARTIKNWLITKSGTLLNRPGTQKVVAALSNNIAYPSWLEQFYFSGDQTYILEFSQYVLRVRDAQGNSQAIATAGLLNLCDAATTGVRYSQDNGATWNGQTGVEGSYLPYAPCFNGTRWVAFTPTHSWYSSDGMTWTVNQVMGAVVADCVWTGTNFIAPASGGVVYISADGLTWTSYTIPGTIYWYSVGYGNGQCILVGRGNTYATLYTAKSTNPNAAPASVTFTASSLLATNALDSVNAILPTRPVWTGSRWFFGYIYSSGTGLGKYHTATYTASAVDGATWTLTQVGVTAMGLPVPPAGKPTCAWLGSTGYLGLPYANTYLYFTFNATGTLTQGASGLRIVAFWVANSTLFYIDDSRKVYTLVSGAWQYSGTWPAAPMDERNIFQSSLTSVASIATPWPASALKKLRVTQSGDVLFLFCYGYPAYKLTRSLSNGYLIFSLVTAQPVAPTVKVGAPARYNTKKSPDDTHPDVEWDWAIVWVDADGNESVLGDVFYEQTSQCYPDRPTMISWTGVAGAKEYFIFRGRDGQFGYIGTKPATAGTGTEYYTDTGEIPDLSVQPRTYEDALTNDPPSMGMFFQDRLFIANTPSKPSRLRGSATGDYLNFDTVKYQTAASPYDFTANSRRFEEIRAIIPLKEIVILTSESECSLSSPQGSGISPLQVSEFQVHSKRGCSWVEPVVVGHTVIFVQRDGQVVRDLIENVSTTVSENFGTTELTMFVDHLLSGSGRTIVDMAYCQHPHGTLWFVLSDGKVLSLSYIPELKQVAWAQHDFGGTVECVCSVFNGSEDLPWFSVYRSGVRWIERLTTRTQFWTLAAATMLDSAEVFTGGTANPAVQFPNGTVVGVVRDGVYQGTQTVAGGAVTASAGYARLVVGLVITSDFESLDEKSVRERQKAVARSIVEISNTINVAGSGCTIQAGMNSGSLVPKNMSDIEDNRLEVQTETNFNAGGRVFVRVANPVPVEILSVAHELVAGQ